MSQQESTQPGAEPQNSSSSRKDNKDWHQGIGLTLTPLFDYQGYDAEVEVDLSKQKQLIDIIAVRRREAPVNRPRLPDEYWEAFENFNEYNLITFKSYSESFNAFALEELYGHLINYCKVKGYKREQVNLYAISHYYPEKLLKSFVKENQVKVIKENEIYDLCLGELKTVRIIVCRETDNPILALFSGNQQKFVESYRRIQHETDLFDNVSGYFDVFREYYGSKLINMYTREDYFREHPPTEHPPMDKLEEYLWAYGLMKILEKEKMDEIQVHKDELREEGREEGREEARQTSLNTLLKLLVFRYPDAVPFDEWQPRLAQCTLLQIKFLTDHALDTDSLEIFQSHLDSLIIDDQTDDEGIDNEGMSNEGMSNEEIGNEEEQI